MIFFDADNIPERSPRPSQEAIQEETRRQLETLKNLRRCLTQVTAPRAVGSVWTEA